jgi:hypothetical protein
LILGDDRHDSRTREHLEHFVVIRVRKRSVFSDAGVTCHFDDEGVIVRGRRA